MLTQSRNFHLLASFSPLFHHPSHTPCTHTLSPPTLPHPAHHCLVNLLKTPICLSDLNGSGFPQASFKLRPPPPHPARLPLSSSPYQASPTSTLLHSGCPESSPVMCRPPSLYSCHAPLWEHSPFLHSATANSNQRVTVETRKKESTSLCTPVLFIQDRLNSLTSRQHIESAAEEVSREEKQKVRLSRL